MFLFLNTYKSPKGYLYVLKEYDENMYEKFLSWRENKRNEKIQEKEDHQKKVDEAVKVLKDQGKIEKTKEDRLAEYRAKPKAEREKIMKKFLAQARKKYPDENAKQLYERYKKVIGE